MRPWFVLFCLFIVAYYSMAQEENPQRRQYRGYYSDIITHKDTTRVHDPVMIKENGRFYIFCTGRGISVFSSEDMIIWKHERPVFLEPPQWALESVPDFRGHIWAPDIAFYKGKYYLYYSVSSFGKNSSAIGLATNKTLDSESPDYKWTDHGEVIRSIPGKTNWNAIDPNFILDKDDTPYLNFGSFWGGIMLARLNKEGFLPDQEKEDFKVIATRKMKENAIEAPFIFKKDDYYYLFVSFDFCCRGENSTYKIVVGRSENLEGEYFDEDGNSMLEGGGTIVIEGGKNHAGVGHNAVVAVDDTDYLIFHAYDLNRQGASFLKILPIYWENGWPRVEM